MQYVNRSRKNLNKSSVIVRQKIKNIIKNTVFIFIILLTLTMFFIVLYNNRDKKLVDYKVEFIETMPDEKQNFSFEKRIINNNEVVAITKKQRDTAASENIKDLIELRTKKPVKVKGVYLPAYVVGNDEKFPSIFENIKKSNINTIVVDVKDELGRITFKMDNDFVRDMKTIEPQIKDIDTFINNCKENNIYVIARISSFIDEYAGVRNYKNLALRRKDGKLYKDNSGYYWLNPYNEQVQKYLIEIGKGCAKAGFDEVQYDYFRFSADGVMRNVVFDEEETKGRTKIEIITEVAQILSQELIKENIFVSIDVFGAIMNSYKDQFSIGQEYQTLLKFVDYLCPMVYPSHYANQTFGLNVPDLYPYDTVLNALSTSKTVIDKTYDSSYHYGIIRPWLQGFTANYLAEYKNYDVDDYKAQIKAVEDSGLDEWIFWHPGGVYKWDAFMNNNE